MKSSMKLAAILAGCLATSMVALALAPAYSAPNRANAQQALPNTGHIYKTLPFCLDARNGVTPASKFATIEQALNNYGKGGFQLISVERTPNLFFGNRPDGKPNIHTDCYIYHLRK